MNTHENKYESTEICKACGGNCCKSKGCSLSPQDLWRELEKAQAAGQLLEQTGEVLQTTDMLDNYLPGSDLAIDRFSWQGKPFYYLRMRHKCFTFIGVDAMGECIALTNDGCIRQYEDRPKGGRFLEGKEDRRCEQHYTQEMMVEDWTPYQETLRRIWNIWHDRMEQDGTFDQCEEDYMQYQMKKRQGRLN